jgi:hypothetical protein
MKTYRGMDVQINAFFTSIPVGGERSVSRPGKELRVPTNWMGGWVDPRAGVDDMKT